MKNAANKPSNQTVTTDLERRLLVMLEEKNAVIGELQQQVKSFAQQVDWFTRQVFGQKSEKRDMTDNPYQTTIADVLKTLPELPKAKEEEKQTFTVTRGKAKKNTLEGSPDDSGIRFDPSVPVEEITLSAPELSNRSI